MEKQERHKSPKEKQRSIHFSKPGLREALKRIKIGSLALGALAATETVEARSISKREASLAYTNEVQNNKKLVLDPRLTKLDQKLKQQIVSIQSSLRDPSLTIDGFYEKVVKASKQIADRFYEEDEVIDGEIGEKGAHIQIPNGFRSHFEDGALGNNVTLAIDGVPWNFSVAHNPRLPKTYRTIAGHDIAIKDAHSANKSLFLPLERPDPNLLSVTVGSDGEKLSEYVGPLLPGHALFRFLSVDFSSFKTVISGVDFNKLMKTPGMYCKILPTHIDGPDKTKGLRRSGSADVQVKPNGEVVAVAMQSFLFNVDFNDRDGEVHDSVNFGCYEGAENMKKAVQNPAS